MYSVAQFAKQVGVSVKMWQRGTGTEVVVMNTETLSPEQELLQDLMSILHCLSSRLYGLRKYRKALEKALKDENCAQDPDEPDA